MGAPLLLLQAAYSYRAHGEDRLTELFAATLAAHPGLCRLLHDRLELPAAEQYLITTQHRIDADCRLDMRIEARNASNATTSVVYSEHKIDGYWFSEGQVEREKTGLQREHATAKRMICVVSADELAMLRASELNAPPGAMTADDFDTPFSWKQIATLAQEAGRAWPRPWGGPGWADRALEPDAPAAQRVLVEFLAYLEEDEVPEAVSPSDLLAFRLADQAQDKLETLLVSAAEHVDAFALADANKKTVYDDRSSTGVPLTCINFVLPQDHWATVNEENTLSAAIATTDAAAPWGGDEPQVYAGLYLADEQAVEAQADQGWMTSAAAANLKPLAYEPGLWIVATRPLSDFTAAASTFEEQAERLGHWFQQSLRSSTELQMPERDSVQAGRSRGRVAPRPR